MSGKLDQSLDEIVSTQRKAGGRRGRNPARRVSGRPTTTAPVGGVQKSTKKPQAAAKQAPAKAAGGPGDSKVVVSNLPKDVTESQIKEYFLTSVGPIKRLELAYGPGGASRGVATITFAKGDGASKAFNQLNGLLVDGRPIKIEIIVSGDKAAAIAPAPKTLTERISQPKSQPKSAAPNKKKAVAAKDNGATRGRGGRARGKSSRPAKKSAEELDSEMADYFEAGNQNENTNSGAPAAAAAATNGDAPMEDEIL